MIELSCEIYDPEDWEPDNPWHEIRMMELHGTYPHQKRWQVCEDPREWSVSYVWNDGRGNFRLTDADLPKSWIFGLMVP